MAWGTGAAILDVTRLGGEGSQARHVYDVAVVSAHHARQKLLHQQDRCDDIHIKGLSKLGFEQVKQWHGISDACVVDENRWIAMFSANTFLQRRLQLKGLRCQLCKKRSLILDEAGLVNCCFSDK